MRTIVLALGLAALAAGCDCDRCESAIGRTYLVTFEERSGDCGYQPEVVVTGTDQIPAGCTGEFRLSDDRCAERWVAFECPSGPGRWLRVDGRVDLSCDGSSAEGTWGVVVLDGPKSVVCSGTYDLVYEEL